MEVEGCTVRLQGKMMLGYPGLDHDKVRHYELYFECLVQYQLRSSPAPPQEDRPVHLPQLWWQSKTLAVNCCCSGWSHSQADMKFAEVQ